MVDTEWSRNGDSWERRSEYDVTNHVNVTHPEEVSAEVLRILHHRLDTEDQQRLARAFIDFTRLFRGEYPGYLACDTQYHNLQHTLDVTLANARLLEGHEKQQGNGAGLGSKRILVGMLCGLFHDSGYIRHTHDTKHRSGAEYTLIHVTRSARFLQEYLPQLDLEDWSWLAEKVVHFTGYEMQIADINLPDPTDRQVGYLLGTADLMAQMADRCYLEKCRDRLFPEFVDAGIARRIDENGKEIVVYASKTDLLRKTPEFYLAMKQRMDEDLGGVHIYSASFFDGADPYQEAIERNLGYIRKLIAQEKLDQLRRRPPEL